MNELIKLSNKLKILKISVIYGGLMSFLLICIYLLIALLSPGTLKYLLIQVVLLPIGVLLVTIFSYLHLDYIEITSKEKVCSLLLGSIISVLCISPGLIISISGLTILSTGEFFAPVIIISFIGIFGLILGVLSILVVLKGNRTAPKNLEPWKIMGLRASTLILAVGVIITIISIASGVSSKPTMTYEIILETSEYTTFLIPVPLIESGQKVSEVVDNLKLLEGTADWKIVDTEYGKALEVNTRLGCILSAEKEFREMSWDEADEWLSSYSISMLYTIDPSSIEDNVNQNWVFSSSENTTMHFSLSLNDGWNEELNYIGINSNYNDRYSYYELPLDEGWQTIYLEPRMMMYD